MSFKINDRCTGCTACKTICPTGAIHGESRRLHVIDPARCIGCGACGVTCRDEAVLDHEGVLFSLFDPPARARAWVDVESCTGCGRCRGACPWDAIEPALLRTRDGALLRFATVSDAGCVACGACELECSDGAIRVLRPGDPAVGLRRERNASFLEARGIDVALRADEAAQAPARLGDG